MLFHSNNHLKITKMYCLHFSIHALLIILSFDCSLGEKFKPDEPILSENNHLVIHFTADDNRRLNGFFATYEVQKKCKIYFQLKKKKFIITKF